jgi:hypothetical protein
MPRVLFLSLAFAVAASAQLTSERPLSTPEYGRAPGDQAFSSLVATNGSEFLVAWPDGRANQLAIYANRVASDGRVLDGTGIRVPLQGSGNLQLRGLHYIDGAYTLIYSYGIGGVGRTAIAIISADGVLIDGPRTILEEQTTGSTASNGSRIVLATVRDFVVIDARGNVQGRYPIPSPQYYGYGIASNGRTFLAVTYSYDGATNSLNFIALDAAGKPTVHQAINTSASGDFPLIASDGGGYLVVYYDDFESGFVARHVDATGATLSTTRGGSYGALVWTGESYVAILQNIFSAQHSAVNLDRDGKPTGAVRVLGDSTPDIGGQLGAAWNGSELLVSWATGQQFVGSGFDVVGVLIAADATLASPVIQIPSASNAQMNPAVASSGSQDLAVWAEGTGIYATRMTVEGVPLDGRGIAVSADPAVELIGVVYDGEAYLVAWKQERTIKAQRIDRNGALRGSPVELTSSCIGSFDVAVDDKSPVLFFSSGPGVFAQRVIGGTPVGAPVAVTMMNATSPRAAWNGTEWLVAWAELLPLPGNFGIVPSPMFTNIHAARMSAALTLLDTNAIPIAISGHDERIPFVASDGSEFLVTWTHGSFDAAAGIFTRRVQPSGETGDATLLVPGTVAAQGIAWNGHRYTIAYGTFNPYLDGELFLTHVGANDQVLVSTTSADYLNVSFVAPPGRPLRIVYARIAPEPIYGGVDRIFMRDESGVRRRAVR